MHPQQKSFIYSAPPSSSSFHTEASQEVVDEEDAANDEDKKEEKKSKGNDHYRLALSRQYILFVARPASFNVKSTILESHLHSFHIHISHSN